MYYNGHYITNLFIFSACEQIISCVPNVPGSIYDSTIADWGGVYSKLEKFYERTGAKCCVDPAFASKQADI